MQKLDTAGSLHQLFRRCVKCPPQNPACPSCPSGQTCSLSIQSCTACASTSCVATSSIAPPGTSSGAQPTSQSAAGPIAGGVVGGILVIIILTYLLWRFFIKKRRQQFDDNVWPEEASGIEKGGDQFSLQRAARASTHTVGSVASSTFTRASNVIQIAYIPGVTNRSIESSPELVPPVPPIPAASSLSSVASTPHIPTEDQHFFLPDMRASTYSALSDRSMARSSVATTIYRNNAIVDPIPAQQVMRGKAVPVSVKSSLKNSPQPSRSSTPPLPTTGPSPITQPRQAQFQLNTKSSIVGMRATPKAVTVGRSTAAPAEPVYELSGSERSVTPLSLPLDRRILNGSPLYNNDSSTFDDGSSDDDDLSAHGVQSLMPQNRRSDATTVIQEDSPISPSEALPGRSLMGGAAAPIAGPSSPKKHMHKKSSSINQIIEEATRKAMREPRHGGLGSYRSGGDDAGPFSDANIAGTP
jgi:hypothetical protein